MGELLLQLVAEYVRPLSRWKLGVCRELAGACTMLLPDQLLRIRVQTAAMRKWRRNASVSRAYMRRRLNTWTRKLHGQEDPILVWG